MLRYSVWIKSALITFAIFRHLCISPVDGQSTTSEEDDFNPYTMCTLVPNGTYINDPNDCVTWIQCVDEEPIYGTCENDTFYDLETNECVPADSITCLSTNPCAAVPNGFASDPYSCSGYYYCTNGQGAHGTCSSGLNFNPATQSCIRNFPCTLADPTGYCNIVPDGVFIQNSSSCNGWEMCWEGVVEGGTCPGTFYYNAFSGDCDYPENVNCTIQSELPSGEVLCPEPGAFISDNATCNGYYYCRETANGDIVLQHADCPNGRFFNPYVEGGACVPRTDMVCEYDRCAGMGIDVIQLANGSEDDCKGYLVCQNGVTIGNGTCPDDAYYDEIIQLCTAEVVDFRACNGTTLNDKTTSETPSTTTPTLPSMSTEAIAPETTTPTTTKQTTMTDSTISSTTEPTTTTTTIEPTTKTTTTTTVEPTTITDLTTTTTEPTTTSSTTITTESTTTTSKEPTSISTVQTTESKTSTMLTTTEPPLLTTLTTN